jgi:hypothetical protein
MKGLSRRGQRGLARPLRRAFYGSRAVLKSPRDCAMLVSSMRRVGLVDVTVGNATRLRRIATFRQATLRVAPHRYATLEPLGKPGGSRAFSADACRNSVLPTDQIMNFGGRERDLSRYRRPTSAPFGEEHLDRRSVVNGNIFNSKGVHVGVIVGDAVFGLKGQKPYDLRGSNIYKLNGDLVSHLSDPRNKEKRLDKTTDKLFPQG